MNYDLDLADVFRDATVLPSLVPAKTLECSYDHRDDSKHIVS